MRHLSLVERAPAALLAGLLVVGACSDSTAVSTSSGGQLAFTTRKSSTSSAAQASLIPVTKNGHTLDLTQVTVVVDRAELKRNTTDVCRGDNDDEDDDDDGANSSSPRVECGEVKVGPALVDLPLDGKLVTLPANTVPAGTFRQIEIRISLVRLVGTFDGKPFDVTVQVNAKSEIEFPTPIVVAADAPVAVTVNLPVDTWLVNADGSLVDPNTLRTSPAAMDAVKKRIAASIGAFEDRDHDGNDDHENRNRR